MGDRLPRLITIRFSHYCEKARWALQHHGIGFVEEAHLPVFTYLSTFPAGGKRTVPVLVAGGETYADSTDILRYTDRVGRKDALLFPADVPEAAELEDHFDEKLGPATRRLAYFYVLDDPKMREVVLRGELPAWEKVVGRLAFPVVKSLIRSGLKVDASGRDRSKVVVDRVFGEVSERLADGRRYLAGDRFTAADLAFAALATPIVAPEAFQKLGASLDEFPPELRALVEEYRRTKAGAFALAMYERHREAGRR